MHCCGQTLRIDLNRIDKEGASKKTNGEYLDYLESEVRNVSQIYGKLSKEYIFLKGFYLDEYNRRYQPLSTLNPISLDVMNSGRKEVFDLIRQTYSDSAVEYYSALNLYSIYCTSAGSPGMKDDNELILLVKLFKNAVPRITTSNLLSDTDQHFYIYTFYTDIASLYRKAGLLDSAIKYYKIALNYRENNSAILYGLDNFIQILRIYAGLITRKDAADGFNILLDNEELIEEKYAINKPWFIDYLYDILDHYINNNNIDMKAISYLKKTDSAVKETYKEQSTDYLKYLLYHKIQVLKRIGYKSQVFQELSFATEIFNKDKKLLSGDLFFQFYIEWFDYYKSVGELDKGIANLKWASNYVNDSFINPNTLANSIYIYRELGYFYQYKYFDSCLFYHLKVLDFEKKAKREWGDYTIHQYHELAKLLVSTDDTAYYDNALKFCYLALSEFEYAYGRESGFYKSALYTLGEIKFKRTNGRDGLQEMAPTVYNMLNNPTFVPPLNTSHFLNYGDCLNYVNKFDSADFFYEQIYLRNQNSQFFRILGNSNDLQLKALNDIYVQNNLILTQHLQRYNQTNYSYVLPDLAKWLFDKNSIYQVEIYNKEAQKYGRINRKNETYASLVKSKIKYDSLLNCREILNKDELDTAYTDYDFYKNSLIQDYILNAYQKKQRLSKLDSDFSFSEIREKLNNNECLIDVVRFLRNDPQNGFSQDPYYAIVILTHSDSDKLEYFFLQNGRKFENLMQGADVNYDAISNELNPVIAKLKSYNTIYFCPDGVFNLLNLYSLKDENQNYLAKNKTVKYINSIKDIFLENRIEEKDKDITFFGNPKFDRNYNNNSPLRNITFIHSTFSNFSELPYSKVEIETIEKKLTEKGWKCRKYLGDDCSEENLHKLTLSGILHIATHGFYISEDDTVNFSHAMQSNQYLRSGLVLGSPAKNEDNILSAYEVMDLNLKDVSLVVLSACESGKGKILPGQGVYGLQRAFFIAGAKNVLISVRNVDDKATELLMKYFYNRVAEGENYIEALRQAQLEMIVHPIYNNPKYWSGFILLGS